MNVVTFNGLELEWKEHMRLVSKKDSEATVETISAEIEGSISFIDDETRFTAAAYKHLVISQSG